MGNAKFLNLDWKDILKGFILAVIAALVAGVYAAIQTGGIDFTWLFWKPILFSSIGAGLAYLIKNLFTNSQDQFLTPEQK